MCQVRYRAGLDMVRQHVLQEHDIILVVTLLTASGCRTRWLRWRLGRVGTGAPAACEKSRGSNSGSSHSVDTHPVSFAHQLITITLALPAPQPGRTSDDTLIASAGNPFRCGLGAG